MLDGDRGGFRLDFEDFYRAEYSKVLRSTQVACGNSDLAAEATQEAFSRAFARWWTLRDRDWAVGWVITTSLNYCRRHSSRALKGLRLARQLAEHTAVPAAEREAGLDLEEGIRGLAHRQRQAVVLYYVADLPVYAVAEAMGIGEGAVKSHLSRARQNLRDRLSVQDG